MLLELAETRVGVCLLGATAEFLNAPWLALP